MAHSLAGNSRAAGESSQTEADESSALVGNAMGTQAAASVDTDKHHGISDVSDSEKEDEGDMAEESDGSGSFCCCCMFKPKFCGQMIHIQQSPRRMTCSMVQQMRSTNGKRSMVGARRALPPFEACPC